LSAKHGARRLAIVLWVAMLLSLAGWSAAGYAWPLCAAAALPLLAPLAGLIRGRRHMYAWATLFAIPYLTFSITELLVNPAARWVDSISLCLIIGWFGIMVLSLRVSEAHRE